jgi:hypothetical protein
MAAAPVVEAPGIGLGLLTIGAATMFAAAWSGDTLYRNIVSPVIRKIADIGFGGVRGVGDVHPFRFLGKFDDKVLTTLHNAKVSTEHAMVSAFNLTVKFHVALAHNIAATSEDAYNAMHRLQFYWTPYFVGVKLRPIQTGLEGLRGTVGHAAAKSHPNSKVAVKKITYNVTKVTHVTKMQAATTTAGARIKPAEWKAAKHELAKLMWAVPFAGLLTFGLALLKRLGLSWLRCPRVGKVGKTVCTMNPGLLESLLLDAALLTVAFNLEDFARELQSVTEDAAGLINRWAT